MLASKILIKMSGSIACYKVCELISKFHQEGHLVQVVCTENTLKFIGRSTLEGLSHRPLVTDVFTDGRPMDHIDLDRWADMVLLAPATANTINKLAAGLSDDIVSTLFLAHDNKKPYFLAPAMNSKMYLHPSTQESLKKLAQWGVTLLGPDQGSLACGEVGPGRLIDINKIYSEMMSSQPHRSPSRGKVLITSGGTKEPIDGVRSISNFSSGRTGLALADVFAENNYDVTLVHAESAITNSQHHMKKSVFTDFSSLAKVLEAELSENNYDLVIHSAAVSDFKVDSRPQGKISSDKPFTLNLKPNPKLIHYLKDWSANPKIKVIAFKLTRTTDRQERSAAINKLLNHPNIDFVVHNDLIEIESSQHIFRLYNSREKKLECASKTELGNELVKLLETPEPNKKSSLFHISKKPSQPGLNQ